MKHARHLPIVDARSFQRQRAIGAVPARRRLRALPMLLAALALATGGAIMFGPRTAVNAGSTVSDYKLGALDRIRVKVVEWRASRDEVFEWAALNGEYTIGPTGNVALPLLGEVNAAGATSAVLARAIGKRLRERMGLAATPDTSIEIVQFRPFYVVGHVERPGEFPYRPGMTVLQALSLSGGLPRGVESSGARLEREAISTRGDLEILAKEAASLLARRARFQAETKGASQIEFPASLEDRKQEPNIVTLLEHETLIFRARLEAFQTQIAALGQLEHYLSEEANSLVGQLNAHNVQMRLVKEELDGVARLTAKGLSTVPRKLALERNAAQLEGDRLRLEMAVLKARQELSRTQLSAIELRNRRVNEATNELQQTQIKLEQIKLRFDTASKLLDETEMLAPRIVTDASRTRRIQPIFKVMRTTQGMASEFTAAESTQLEPGDTLKVEMPRFEDGLAKLLSQIPDNQPAAAAGSGGKRAASDRAGAVVE